MPTKKRYLTQADFARLVGFTDAGILYNIQNRRLPVHVKAGVRKLDLREALPIIFAVSKRPVVLQGSQHELSKLDIPEEFMPDFDEVEDGGNGRTKVIEAKEQSEIFKAKKVELEYNVAVGKLVSIDTVANQWRSVGVLIRKTILNIPDRLTHLVTSESDPVRVHALLDGECRAILEDLADELDAAEEETPVE